MLLVLDVGNTSTTVGVYDKDTLIHNWRIDTKKEASVTELVEIYSKSLAKIGCVSDDIKGVAVSSVVPSLDNAISDISRECFGITPFFVNADNAGIKFKCYNPATIGADRLVNAIAAYSKHKSSVIVVDMGTATTFDYIDEEGVYHGGPIAPGIGIINEVLGRRASKLTSVDIKKTDKIMGRSTEEAVQAGVYHGYVGLVKYIIAAMNKELGVTPKIVATGGFAQMIAEDVGAELDIFLTLDGLRIFFQRFLKTDF